VAFVVMVALLLVAATGYVSWARARVTASPSAGAGVGISPGAPAMLFRDLEGDAKGRVALVPIGNPNGPRRVSTLTCDRVHFASGRGLCLAYGSQFPPRPMVKIFGSDFVVDKSIPLAGIPSRARVSADGRYGAATFFVTGHSYADSGFSTGTILIDMAAGRTVANMEQFGMVRDGKPFRAVDVNFWGVTFASDSNRFYATLGTGGRTFLVEGNIAARRVTVKTENVECPSLSPDGTRIGFKKRVDSTSSEWRFHVLDLASGRQTPLSETRSVDDQLEWLDNDTLVYSSPDSSNAVMSVRADGTGEPRQLVSQAASPTVLRTPLPESDVSQLQQAPVAQPANVSVTTTAAATMAANVPTTQTITVTNNGPAVATRLDLEFLLRGPGRVGSITGAPHDPALGGGYGCGVSGPAQGQCDLESLPVGASWTFRVTVTATARGRLHGEAIVSATEPDPDDKDNRASATTTSE
jgi:hypothetical protein